MENKNLSNQNIDIYADMMINRIVDCINEMMKEVPKIKSAIVESVNEDGTVNVTLPGDLEHIYTKIQNQSIYQDLKVGDMVKLLLEDGSFSNCWIIARYPKNEDTFKNMLENYMNNKISSFIMNFSKVNNSTNNDSNNSENGIDIKVQEEQPQKQKRRRFLV